MSELEETILRMRLREKLRSFGVGRMLREHPEMYETSKQRCNYRTKYVEGNIPAGQQLLRCFKEAEKAFQRCRTRDKRYQRYFWVRYSPPSKHQPGYLEAVHLSREDREFTEEF